MNGLNYLSNNQRLRGIPDQRTLLQPIITPPSHNIEFWRNNNFVNNSTINSRSVENISGSGYRANYPNKNIKPIPPIAENTSSKNIYVQPLQPNVFTNNKTNPISSNIGIEEMLRSGNRHKYHDLRTGETLFFESRPEKIAMKFLVGEDYQPIHHQPNTHIYTRGDNIKDIDYTTMPKGIAYHTNIITSENDAIKSLPRDDFSQEDYMERYRIPEVSYVSNENEFESLAASTQSPITFIDRNNTSLLFSSPDNSFYNMNQVNNDKFHDDTINFRNDMMETLMRKKNGEMWQKRVAPMMNSVTGY